MSSGKEIFICSSDVQNKTLITMKHCIVQICPLPPTLHSTKIIFGFHDDGRTGISAILNRRVTRLKDHFSIFFCISCSDIQWTVFLTTLTLKTENPKNLGWVILSVFVWTSTSQKIVQFQIIDHIFWADDRILFEIFV